MPLFVVVPVGWGAVTWVLAGAACWAAISCLILALLSTAKHVDAAGAGMAAGPPTGAGMAAGPPTGAGMAAGPPAVVGATSERLGRLVLDVRGALGVERVAIVMLERAAPDVGVIVACCGCPQLVGSRIQVDGGFGWGPGAESRFLVEPPWDWNVVSVPIAGPTGIAGTMAVATRRRRGISALEVGLLERMTVRAAVDDVLATGGRGRMENTHGHLA